MLEFYTYVYLDPRFKGNYQYYSYEFEALPIYIGKGSNDRLYSHCKEALITSSFFSSNEKISTIKSILESGQEPIIIKIEEDLTESEAYFLEKSLIQTIGRKDKNEGPLLNKNDGSSNAPKTSELYKQMLSEMTNEYFRLKHFV